MVEADKEMVMVDDPRAAPLALSPAQLQMLTFLGYKRWIVRDFAPPAPEVVPEVVVAPPAEDVPPTPADEYTIFFGASTGEPCLHVSYDFVLLRYSPAVAFLLPPLWANATGLQCFATDRERALWLAAWRAVDLPAVAEVFAALFAKDLPIRAIAHLPLSHFPAPQRALICVGSLSNVAIPVDWACHALCHPWFLLQAPQQKRLLWQQLLTLKETLF